MAQNQLLAFISAIRADRSLQQELSTTRAADADEVAGMAQRAGFSVTPKDLVSYADGALVEYTDEDYFMKSRWWDLAP